jgi:putative DNA-invertase from lambdoid prophage Rac
MAVYGYARVSTARQANEGESLEVQRRQIEGYAMMQALVLDEILVEEGVSGSVPLQERPIGTRLLAKVTKGDIIIAAKLDRCFRSALDALNVVEKLKVRGVKLHLLDLGGDIAGNGLSKLFLTIAAAFAEAERDRIRERISNVKQDQKARGRYLGGKVPFGFRLEIAEEGGKRKANLVEYAPEQEAVRAVIAMRAQGMAFRRIAAALAERGIKISHETVKQVVAARLSVQEIGDPSDARLSVRGPRS